MMIHYAILAIRNIKKFSLNAIMNCCLQVFCLSTFIILMLHISKGSVTGNYQILILFLMVFIMLIAGINFYNLSTLQVIKRRNELGLRVMLGAAMIDLSLLVIVEAILRMGFAILISLVFADMVLPLINKLTVNQVTLKHDFSWKMIPFLILFQVVTSIIVWINMKINRSKLPVGFIK